MLMLYEFITSFFMYKVNKGIISQSKSTKKNQCYFELVEKSDKRGRRDSYISVGMTFWFLMLLSF
jgi:hypothetical protein